MAVALRLAASMLALQASIGAVNDLVDAGIDSGRKPGKPLPRGAARPTEAAALAVAGLVVGIALSAVSGLPTALVALAGVGCGYAYDLRLSRTAWSWLPLAAALPLVPLHAWLGVTGSAPGGLIALLPAGLLAGAGLALGNGLADEERDRSAGLRTAAVALGTRRAWALHALALAGAVAIALVAAPARGGGGDWRTLGLAGAAALLTVGSGLSRSRRPGVRERGWELEGLGVALLGIAWIAGLPTV